MQIQLIFMSVNCEPFSLDVMVEFIHTHLRNSDGIRVKVKLSLQEIFQCHFSWLNKFREGLWHMKNKPESKAEKQSQIHETSKDAISKKQKKNPKDHHTSTPLVFTTLEQS